MYEKEMNYLIGFTVELKSCENVKLLAKHDTFYWAKKNDNTFITVNELDIVGYVKLTKHWKNILNDLNYLHNDKN